MTLREPLPQRADSRQPADVGYHASAALSAVRGSRSVSRRASNLAWEAAQGAVQAVGEMALGAVEAAYQIGQSHGDSVRQSVVRRVPEPRLAVAADLGQRLSEMAYRLSIEPNREQATWRGRALISDTPARSSIAIIYGARLPGAIHRSASWNPGV